MSNVFYRQRALASIAGIMMLVWGLTLADVKGALLGFQQAVPGYTWSFPMDHAAHPAYRTEWWYYTGHLHTKTGRRFGYQLTFFRHRLDSSGPTLNPSQWFADNIYMAHMAITDISAQRFTYGEKLNRAALGLAGASAERYHVWNEDWSAERLGEMHYLVGDIPGYKLKLLVTPLKPVVLHGVAQDGLSQKGQGQGHASHYYSFTRLQTVGVLQTSDGALEVEGLSWMDHEFGSSQLQESQVGWDWFSVQLANNYELMVYHIRHKDGSIDPHSSGTLVQPDGTTLPLRRDEMMIDTHATWKSPKSGAVYPQRWTIRVPKLDLTLHLEPVLAAQELVTDNSTRVTYWEGSVTATGRMQGQTINGAGYVELTGYARKVSL